MNDKYYTPDQIQELMDAIDPCSLSYDEWFRAVAGFKYMEAAADQIEQWCSSDPRFKGNDVSKRWDGITDSGGITTGTIIYYARERGYTGSVGGPYKGPYRGSKSPTEEPPQTIECLPDVPGSFFDFQREMLEGMSQAEQRRAFLETMFSGGEYINFVFNSQYDGKKEKWRPLPDQKEAYTRDEWLGPLHFQEWNDYNHSAGAWMRINPTIAEPQGAEKQDGSRGVAVCDEDIASFRYALIECDDIPEAEQIEAFRRLNLPIQTLVLSGGKSVHAAVLIDAKDRKEYDERVSKLHDWCRRYGVPIDGANKNPSRMIRVPGFTRGEREQQLIGLKQGPSTWNDFQFYMEGVELGLPELDAVEDINGENLPQRMPEIIQGVLREKEVMEISGGSKSAKTFLLIELFVAAASGGLWLGRACAPVPTLYVNTEVNRAAFANRLERVREAMGVSLEDINGRGHVWNLRGYNSTIDDMVNGIRHLLKKHKFKLVIIDPIYKLMGDLEENSAGDMGTFFSRLDAIAEMAGAGIVFVHHHSKGGQAGKLAMERSSGSGVFARAPDAILDVLELETPPNLEEILEFESKPVGVRYEWTLRDYPPREPETGFFTYPIHVPDETGILRDARTAKEAHAIDAKKLNANKQINWADVVVTCYTELMDQSFMEPENPYRGQVLTDQLLTLVQSRTNTSDDTTRKRVGQRCVFSRAKPSKGIPSFVELKPDVASILGLPSEIKEEEATDDPENEEEFDFEQIKL